MNINSRLLENAVNELSTFPGIGKRTALRFALHLLKTNSDSVKRMAEAIVSLRSEIRYCSICCNISEQECCEICSDNRRDHAMICVVQDIRDVLAIEHTSQYRGVYHVLGGIISPMDGIGPAELNIEPLLKRVSEGNVKEIIMALSATMEGDTTVFYLNKKVKEFNVFVSTIARGVAVGGELEYADEITLGRSIINRTPYEQNFSTK